MIGIDLVYVPRFEKVLKCRPILDRAFTKKEQMYLEGKPIQSIAGIWAGKEAAAKALGTGFNGEFGWRDFEILHDHGKPYVHKPRFMELSISHDGDYVIAIASYRENLRHPMPPRTKNTHKGDYGKVMVIGGQKGMVGSVSLASLASLRTGSGLTYTLVPGGIYSLVQAKALEAVIVPLGEETFFSQKNQISSDLLHQMDAVALGPGIGKRDETKAFVEDVIDRFSGPMVIDADAFSHLENCRLRENMVVTPHEREFARWQGLDIEEVHKDRRNLARKIAKKEGCIVVLKGYQTIISDGNGIYTNFTGNSGMATAGSGDVLTGIILSLLGQNMNALDGARLGVYLHGLAGDFAKRKLGAENMLARDILVNLYKAIRRAKMLK